MKRKKPEIVERRRPLVELNLIGEAKGSHGARRRGCLPFLNLLLGVAAALVLAGAGLR